MKIGQFLSALGLEILIVAILFGSAQAGASTTKAQSADYQTWGTPAQNVVVKAIAQTALDDLRHNGYTAKIKYTRIEEDGSFSVHIVVKGRVTRLHGQIAVEKAFDISGEIIGVKVIDGVGWITRGMGGNDKVVMQGCFDGELCSIE